MEPFRGQYTPDQESPGFPFSPNSISTSFPSTPSPYSESFPLKSVSSAYTKIQAPPAYEVPRDSAARKRWRWKFRNISSNFWLWEASACLLSLGLGGVIYWQLERLDGKPLDNWQYKWSPTSSLALAVTVAKASMMIPVASALGQLKWHWFRASRELDGMEHFDEASRGVLGSLRLLWRLKLWRLASVGALITVCAISIDALTQNAVQFQSVPDHTYFSYVYRTKDFSTTSIFNQKGKSLPPSSVLSAIYYAISTSTPPAFEQSLAYCASGNCTFGSYDSLAVDFECIRAEFNQTEDLIQHSGMIDDHFFLNITQDIIISNTTMALPDSGTFKKDIGPLISRWLVLANPSTVRPAPTAFDCAFYWTVKKYSSEVINGIFYETVDATWTNKSASGMGLTDINITPDECWRSNKTIPNTDPVCMNTVDMQSQSSLRAWFNLNDFSLTGYGMNNTESTDELLYWDYTSIFMQAIMSNLTNANESQIFDQVNLTAERLSTTLTTMIRQLPENIYTNGTKTYGESNGTTIWQPDIYYDIQWRYLLFPLILVGMSTLFFLATVMFTWREGGWKSSQLAVVLHGLSEHDSRMIGNVKGYADMREVGRRMHVQLVETETGRKLVSRETLLRS